MKIDKKKLNNFISLLSEKKVRFLLGISLLVIVIIFLLHFFNRSYMVEVPAYGGSVTEGIMGTPRFINPVFAQSSTDKDLTTLVYSGLMRNVSNELVPDLAKEYSVSPDGREYTFILRDNIFFHDKKPVTVDDIIFTVNTIQDFLIKSPYRIRWEGVSVEKKDDKTVVFKLRQPYSGFLKNTTLGILPSHLWENVPPEQFGFSEYNIKPIGSGPFIFKSFKKDDSGIPTEYRFEVNQDFVLGRPYIDEITIQFYSSEEGLIKDYKNGNLNNISSISPSNVNALLEENGTSIQTYSIPRVFGLFFNPNQQGIFRDSKVREALQLAVDRESIINTIFYGYALPIGTPTVVLSEEKTFNFDKERATQILEKSGWKLNSETGVREKKSKDGTIELSFSLSTGNIPELIRTAQMIHDDLADIGVAVEIKVFEPGNLQQDVIRARDYESLLFGQVIEHPADLYAFWHSSQRNDPGLNVSSYTNSKVDEILEKIRVESDKDDRNKFVERFNGMITDDNPAIFLYNPMFIYVTDSKIKGISNLSINSASDRFSEIHKLFINTEKVWSFLVK